MGEFTKKEENEALAAVCTLKRALGIPNHEQKKDEFIGGTSRIHIYTQDSQSAELISELLFRYGNGKRAKYYDARPEIFTLRDTIEITQLPEGGYDASISIAHTSHFAEMILKMVNKHIAPDKTFTR